MKYVLLGIQLIAFCAISACTVSQNNMERIMRQEDISDYRNLGYAVFGCGKDDDFGTEFSGEKNGQKIEGYVCGGWLKGYTVRYK